MPDIMSEDARRGTGGSGQAEQVGAALEQWPPVLVPTDRPRQLQAPARRTAVAAVARAEFGAAADEMVRACFAAMLFRYTGQTLITLDCPAERIRYVVTGDSTPREVADRAEIGPASADGGELELAVHPDRVDLRYDAGLFDNSTITRMLGHVRALVEDAMRSPDRPVKRLRLLPAGEEHRMLVEWNRTGADLPFDLCLHQAFEAQAARTPQAIAVVHRGERWTYERVNAEANRLAHHLRSLEVGPDAGVGLCLDRSPALLVSMLGVMKAGGAYVPLDPDYPAERLAMMVRAGTCAVMISQASLAAKLPGTGALVVLLDRDAEALSARPDCNLGSTCAPEDLCYVIHTSGSTGVPKPIALRHRGVMNNLADLNSRFHVGGGDAVLALSSTSFDMSVYEFLGITIAGGTLVIPDPGRLKDPAHWADLVTAENITIWNSAPALLGLFLDYREHLGAVPLPDLRLAMLSGDWVPVAFPDRLRGHAPGLRFVVLGGAAEASIYTTIYEVDTADPGWSSIPYGRPMANQRTYILDEALQPVPIGVCGQLYLAGIGLARGYLNQPALTAERFIEWSHGEVGGERLYRTGDLARFDADGLIELLGRMDFQVKVNGVRVELGEIEAVLRGHERIRQAAVVAKGGRLIAYVVPDGPAPGTDDLRDFAARRLPVYMIPAVFVRLEELPLTPNGKLDREALPEPGFVGAPYRAPRSAAERIVAEVYSQVLGVARIGMDDDFFAMGGDSVRAIQITSRARARGVVITASQILRLATIAAVAAAATPVAAGESTCAALHAVAQRDMAQLAERYPNLTEVWPLTAMQSGMLFESLLDESPSGANQLQTVYHLSGPVDADRMRAVVQALLDRHATLRAAFVYDAADAPVQVVVDGLEPPWREVDLGGLPPDARDEAFERLLAEERKDRFDLAVPPLLRLALVRFGPRLARLVLTVHHLLIDGWSEQILADEMVRLYAGVAIGPARPYRDFLAWLSRRDRAASARAWLAELGGVDGATILAAGCTSRAQAADIDEVVVALAPGELTPARGLGVTAATVVQGAWAVVLAALTGREEVVFGATVAGRPGELAGVESAVGLFINTIPVRVRARADQKCHELLVELQHRQAALVEHQHYGLADIHEALGVTALFDTLVVFQSFPTVRTGEGEVEVTRVDSLGSGSSTLTWIVDAERLVVQYNRNVFDRPGLEDLIARLRSVARQLAGGGDRCIGMLEDLPVAGAVAAARPRAVLARTARQEALCELFAEVLGVERVGIEDNIFALGCNSLKATRLIGQMRRRLGLEASIRTIFQYPTIAELSDRVTSAGMRPSLRRTSAP